MPVVPFTPVRCPRCEATRPRTTGYYQAKGRRYHVCRTCGLEFLSEEVSA